MTGAQKAIGITDLIGRIASEAARAGGTAREVTTFLSGAKLIARFVPGLSTAIAVLDVAQPIIEKIATAAPIVSRAIEHGASLVGSEPGQALIGDAKKLYALAVNADPERSETDMKAEDVSDDVATEYVASIFERSFFSPQDPRFDRASANLG